MSYFGILYAIRKLPLTLALALAVGMPASAQDKGKITSATPLQPGTTYGVGKTGPAGAARAQAQAVTRDEKRVSIIVKLADAPLAAYKGGVGGLAPTSPAATGARALDASSTASRQYLNYLGQRQAAFAAAAQAISGAEVRQRYDIVLGGVSMLVPETELDAVRALPGVEAVYLDQLLQPDTNVSPQFIGAPTIWRDLGGQDEAGEGVVVGVLDSGIWPEHPSASDPDPAGNGYPPPPTWAGAACEFGNIGHNMDDAPFTCNNKLIGARAFIETYKAVIGLLPTEFDSARDDNGHGTHTATTAAGNAGVDAAIFGVERGTVSGIAPRAHLAAYKVCGDEGCFQSDTVAAVQQAILDGVDVINFSISGGSNPYADVVEQAFLDAYEAGVFVAASAGNSGPAADTVDHRGPWVTTVAASHTNRFFLSEVTLQAGGGATLRLIGASITDGIAAPTPVVQAKDFDPSDDNLCAEEFPAGTFNGQIVVCEVGTPPTRIEKGFNVLQGGASGMLIYNPTLQGIGTDNHHLPAVMLEVDKGQALLDFLESHSDVAATFTPGEAEKVKGDVMAAFSSRGGPGQTLGISKPDVTAPGVQIVAGHTPLAATVAGGPEGELFQAIRGTSMSSPHVAGAAALVVALHPDWTPGQVKSALMTSATSKVLKEDESTPANPFDFGAGRIDLRRAGSVGITFDVSAAEYVELEDELWNANYPSLYLPVMPGRLITTRVATNVLGKDVTYRLSAKSPRDLRITVPHKLKVPKSGDASFDITIDARNVPLGEVRHAAIFLEGRGHRLHLPVSLVRRQPPVTLEKSCEPLTFEEGQTTTCTITATNTAFDPAEVELTDKLPRELKLVKGSVSGANETRNGLEFVGTLAPVVPSSVDIGEGPSPAGGYLPLSGFGFAPIAGVGDETISNFTVPAFEFAGETYTSVGMVSNGYLVVGGGTGNDVEFVNQSLPNPTPPNNVLAPFWTDLDPSKGGGMRVGVLTDGTNDWVVFDWEAVPNFSDGELNSFQVWIGVNGVQDITYAFGNVSDGEGSFLTVGAENRFGNRGGNFYFNGAGTAPEPDLQLAITSTPGGPGETKVVTFRAKGDDEGRFQNCTELTSPLFQGTNLACVDGRVTD